MIWRGTSLVDATVNASFDEDTATLSIGGRTLRVVADNPADVRAVGPEGEAYRLHKRSLTVERYEAECAGRRYEARRTGRALFERRRAITDEAGALVATTIGFPSGDLAVVPEGDVTTDIVFMSWALTLVDAPTRRTLY